MIRTNEKRLPCQSAIAKIKPMFVSTAYYTFADENGFGHMMNAHGGINYSCRIGENCMNMDAPLPVPGVSLESTSEGKEIKVYSCVGDEIIINGGAAAGKKGIITGKIFGEDYTSAYFPADVLEMMSGEEHFLVKCYGTGLRLIDYPEIELMNIAPSLLHKLGITEKDGKLEVPVTHVLDSKLMGEGWGNMSFAGDEIDIATDDRESYERYQLGTLRFGDVVYVQNLDTTHGTSYIQGSCSVGIIVHGDGSGMGFGPGFMAVMSSKKPMITPVVNKDANIALYLGVENQQNKTED